MIVDVIMFLPASFAGFIANSLSDKYGRKLVMSVPLIGQILGSLFFAFVILYELVSLVFKL